MKSSLLVSLLLVALSSECFAAKGLEVSLQGKRQLFLPLGFDQREIGLVARNGSLVTVSPHELNEPKVIPRFRPFSQAEMRGELHREFGKGFEVSGTGNYLVVHPKGAKDLWANRFEQLFRSMTHFFKTRGYPMRAPEFPLVGIVFYSRSQYESYCRRVLNNNASNTYGVYMPTTNRIYLFDATGGTGRKSKHWEENLATVMHEAAHQTAFNTGIHRRLAGTPRWVGEGLGCLFEARGIYNSFIYKNREDRINYGRLLDFKAYVKNDAAQILRGIVASDKPFAYDGGRSYAAAWGLTFYLSEREPRKYVQYLKMVAAHEPLENYGSAERQREFASMFGRDQNMLAARVTRFLDEIPLPKHISR